MPTSTRVDVQAFLDDHPFSAFQWLIFGLCLVIVLLDGFDTAAIGFIAPSLLKEWGIEKSALGPVLSAALFGLVAGALLAGPLADRLGRKLVLTGSVLVFGIACLSSAFAGDLTQLVGLRFVTGVGLGAAMPNAVTLMSEYCPQRLRATMTNLMFCGFPLGAAFGGFLAAWMIPQWGWRSVLVLGGVTPLVLAALLFACLPESVHFLLSRGAPSERIRDVMRRVSESAAQIGQFVMTEPEHAEVTRQVAKSGIGMVLSPMLRIGSVMLWIAYFMGLVIFYALINWMPLLFKDAGLDPQNATLVSALFPLGGVGAVAFGWLMDRFNANRIVAMRLRADRGLDLPDRAGGRQSRPADGRRVRRRRADEHGAVVVAGAGGCVLPDAGPRHRRRLDDGHRPLRRHRRLVPGRRARRAASDLQPDFHRRRDPRRHRGACAGGQAGRRTEDGRPRRRSTPRWCRPIDGADLKTRV